MDPMDRMVVAAVAGERGPLCLGELDLTPAAELHRFDGDALLGRLLGTAP